MEARLDVLIFTILTLLTNQSSAVVPWSSLTPALERMASYGYHMLGYQTPKHQKYDPEIDVPIVWDPIWNGHIPVGDFVSPLLSALGTSQGSGYDKRVVKGYENRLGVRVAVPYFGDFQVTRELGPGRFTDKLGPGKFPYPGLQERDPSYHKAKDEHKEEEHHHHPPQPVDIYQPLKNYPWYRR